MRDATDVKDSSGVSAAAVFSRTRGKRGKRTAPPLSSPTPPSPHLPLHHVSCYFLSCLRASISRFEELVFAIITKRHAHERNRSAGKEELAPRAAVVVMSGISWCSMRQATGDRIIALMDMDCFYVQVEQREEPETWGRPCAVVQYTGGGVIAVNYEARECGVKRGSSVPDCRAKCPNIRLFYVPEMRGKADLTKYRNASSEVFDVLLSFDPKLVVERASIDEAFLDMTDLILSGTRSFDQVSISQVSVAGTDHCIPDLMSVIREEDERLIVGSQIMQMIRDQVKQATNFTCSAGIAHNKVLAKLCAGFKKPNGQSVLPASCINTVFAKTNIAKVRGLGGKLGQEIRAQFAVETMLQLQNVPKEMICAAYGQKTGQWIHDLANGNDDEPVTSRMLNKSVGSGKNFNGLQKMEEVKYWLTQFAGEIVDRLNADRNENGRTATSITASVRYSDKQQSFSRTLPLKEYNVQTISEDIEKDLLSRLTKDGEHLLQPIISLTLSAGRFVDDQAKDAIQQTPRIDSFFSAGDPIPSTSASAADSSLVPGDLDAQPVSDYQEQLIDLGSGTPPLRRGFFYRKTMEYVQNGTVS